MLYQATQIPLIDAGNAVKIFAAGLGRVDVIGQNARFAVFMPTQDIDDGELYNIVEAYITVPLEAVGPAIEMTLMTLGVSIVMPAARYVAQRIGLAS